MNSETSSPPTRVRNATTRTPLGEGVAARFNIPVPNARTSPAGVPPGHRRILVGQEERRLCRVVALGRGRFHLPSSVSRLSWNTTAEGWRDHPLPEPQPPGEVDVVAVEEEGVGVEAAVLLEHLPRHQRRQWSPTQSRRSPGRSRSDARPGAGSSSSMSGGAMAEGTAARARCRASHVRVHDQHQILDDVLREPVFPRADPRFCPKNRCSTRSPPRRGEICRRASSSKTGSGGAVPVDQPHRGELAAAIARSAARSCCDREGERGPARWRTAPTGHEGSGAAFPLGLLLLLHLRIVRHVHSPFASAVAPPPEQPGARTRAPPAPGRSRTRHAARHRGDTSR